MNYYNEFDPKAAAWLRELIRAGHIPAGEVDTRSITDVKPDDLRGFTQCHFFAGIAGWSYALALAGWPESRPVWTGSCPCFPAGTLVYTLKGLVPIESVRVGDFVMTHKGRFKAVTHVGSDYSDTVTLKGQGHWGLTCTPEHPILTPEGWVPSRNMLGKRWALLSHHGDTIKHDMFVPSRGAVWDKRINKWRARGELTGAKVYLGLFDTKEEACSKRHQAAMSGVVSAKGADAVDTRSLGFAKYLGFWLGDGWVSPGGLIICASRDEAALLKTLCEDARLPASISIERTSARARSGSRELSTWITSNFGAGACGKTVAPWVFSMPVEYREALLSGYLLADGHREKNQKAWVASTVSRKLAVSMGMLARQLGKSTSIRQVGPSRQVCLIEGRRVSEQPYYRVTIYDNSRSFQFRGIHGFGLVRECHHSPIQQQVFNLAVADDNSYTADGVVVHNCQPFSDAGKHLGTADERHLWPVFRELIKECNPPVVFGEQVASKAGRDWLAGVRADLEGMAYAVGAADLCAAGVSAPHIRQRLYWGALRLGHAECKGLERHPRHEDDGDESRWFDTSEVGSATEAGRNSWDDYDIVPCADGKQRRIEPGLAPMVAGVPARMVRLRGYGNAIVPPLAAQFIKAFTECYSVTI